MGFQSQAGQVGFKTQTTPGAYDDPGTGGVFVRTRSGALAANRDLLIPDPEVGGGRDTSDAYLGAVSFSGEYDFYARSKALAFFLKAGLGSVTSGSTGSGSTLVGTHTITPTDGPLPWVSIEEAVGGNFEVFNYTDAKCNTFHLEAEANGYLMGTAGFVARLQTAGNVKTAVPPWDTNPMMVGTNINVTYNAIALPAKSFSLDVNNNLEDDDFRLGSFYLGDVTEKQREVTLGVAIRPEDSAIWRRAVYGSAGATAPGGLTDKQQLILTAETYEVIGTTVTKHKITVTVPKAAFTPFGLDVSGDDVIEHDLEIRALRPNPATPILTAVVLNEVAAVA